ncbi:hypothetical protein BD311DRAFT_826750 [Dichomitus squalens]|uniref:HNH nuclease domain-containing protein n=1 Tax=Dichomitus squalens TaxID=114155 RepID=A0A4Q9M4V0_9APHY|nr:hypothetical protein BD311DRAFT_826750 [Dichomitus squalens]
MAKQDDAQNLSPLVEEYLAVFDEPLYHHLDIPSWVLAVSPSAASGHLFTVRKLIRAMYNTAANLRLEDGERYVLTTVCACADNAKKKLSPEAQNDALALYSRQMESALRRDGPKCALTGRPEAGYWALYQWEHPEAEVPGPIWDTVGAAHIFKCPFIHCLPILTTTIRYVGEPLAGITLDILRRYAQLSDECIGGMAVIDRQENAISLVRLCLTQFHTFGFCLIPTEVRQYDGTDASASQLPSR